MKNFYLTILIFLLGKIVLSQPFDISFAVQDETYIPDSVQATNLDQGLSITLSGNDVLRLQSTVTIQSNYYSQNLNVYPNPMAEKSLITFYNPFSSNVTLTLVDITGRLILSQTNYLEAGENSFQLNGVKQGTYLLCISDNKSWQASKKIVSTSNTLDFPSLIKAENASNLKSTSGVQSIVELNYNAGETISLLAFHNGEESSVVEFVPTSSQTVAFYFLSSDLPATPTGLTATYNPSIGCVQLMWNSVQVLNYNVYWSDTENGTYVNFADSENYFYDDCDAAEGDNYYKVRAENSYGESEFSNAAFAHVTMAPVTGLVVTYETTVTGIGYFQLTWDEFPGAYEYKIWVKPPDQDWFQPYETYVTSYQYMWMLEDYNYYYFSVIAYVEENNISDYSEVVAGYVPGPDNVSGVTGTYNSTTGCVNLNWQAYPLADYYEIYRQGPTQSEATYIGYSASTSYSDCYGLSEGVHNYQVIAVQGSEYISFLSDMTPVYVPSQDLEPVTNLSAIFSGGNVHLSWNAFSGAAGYTIWRKGPGDIDFEAFDNASSNSYVDQWTDATGYYYYKVVAHDGTYIISAFSNIATVGVTY